MLIKQTQGNIPVIEKSVLKVHENVLFVCSAQLKTFWTLQTVCAKLLLLSFYSFSTFRGQEHSREWGSSSARVPGENGALPGMPCCQGTEAFNSFSCTAMAASFNPLPLKRRDACCSFLLLSDVDGRDLCAHLFSIALLVVPLSLCPLTPFSLPFFLEVMGWRLDCRVWCTARLIWNNGAL